jgi:alkylhydroperoxidase/carboxymuconolactone decarboxylase family protein YurZ
MTLLSTVSDAEATGKVKEVYEDIKATKGIDIVPKFWQSLAHNPDHLEATWQKLKVVMRPGKLDLLTKEIIALAVSITNNCEY